jgi:hypothetical protein
MNLGTNLTTCCTLVISNTRVEYWEVIRTSPPFQSRVNIVLTKLDIPEASRCCDGDTHTRSVWLRPLTGAGAFFVAFKRRELADQKHGAIRTSNKQVAYPITAKGKQSLHIYIAILHRLSGHN